MYKTLSDIQQKHFLDISGKEYKGFNHEGTFMTSTPYNDEDYNLSPWNFTYIFDEENGYFICELSHRMTNNRIYGWDYKGNKLSGNILLKYFKDDFDSIKIIKRKNEDK